MRSKILTIFIIALSIISLTSCKKNEVDTSSSKDYMYFKSGDSPNSYEIGVDDNVKYNGQPARFLKYVTGNAEGFGTIMRNIGPNEYLGKRVMLSGTIKSQGIENSAGMWMRVDGDNPVRTLGFDNMQNRPIRGTNEWTKYEIVLDVPLSTQQIFIGVLIAGKGTVWFNDLRIDTVNSSVPVTNMLAEMFSDSSIAVSSLPDKLQYIPDGIEVSNSPDTVYAMNDSRDAANYYWYHKTFVKAVKEDLAVTEFGCYLWYQNHWMLANVTDKPFDNKDFAEWYGCPDGKLVKGKTFVDRGNWNRTPVLQGTKGLWYYIGVNSKGEKFKGTAIVEYLGKLKKR